MKITIVDRAEGEEDEIIIRCKQVDESLLKLIYALRAETEKITARQGDKIVQVTPGEIYYFEAVDDRVFLYLEKEVCETRFRLYEWEKRLSGTDFLRISKSTIVNLAKVACLKPAFNGRFEAQMKNGETLFISRQYVPALKEKLGL